MKKPWLLVVAMILSSAGAAWAREATIAEIASDLASYSGRTVTVSGVFAYSEPQRESFFMNQDGTQIEVIVRGLAKINKDFILSLPQNAKTPITIVGTVRRYENRQSSFYLNAISLQNANNTSGSSPRAQRASLADIKSAPASFSGKAVIVNALFSYSEPMRESIYLSDNGIQMEVFVPRDLPNAQKDELFSFEPGAKIEITATGTIQTYANKENAFFMNASSLRW
jgi:hypothetical protein